MKPDFIVIGAMKCATSTVCAYLEDHPDIFMLPRCEPNFFSIDENWRRGISWYQQLFDEGREAILRGEGSNNYSNLACYPKSAARMAQFSDQMKVIYMVRDPVARIKSDWIQRRVDSGDLIPANLDRAVRYHPEIFIDQSLYWKNLCAYRSYFADNQIFVGFMEELLMEPDSLFRRLTDFLGVRSAPAKRGHLNLTSGKSVPGKLYSSINAIPHIDLLKSMVPDGMKRRIKTGVLSQPATRITMAPETRDFILRTVRSDAQQLLEFCGKPADFWESSSPAQFR